MQTVPVSTVKAKLNEYARTVAEHHDRIALTRNGTADTMLIATADLESLEETIAVLSDSEAVAALVQVRSAEGAGELTSQEDMAALLRKRGSEV